MSTSASETIVRSVTDAVTEHDVMVYTEGDCWLLAWALHTVSGLNIIVSGNLDWWDHVALVTSDGYVLDILGWQTTEEWTESWSPRTCTMRQLTTFEDYKERLQIPKWGGSSDYGMTEKQILEMANFLWDRPVHAGKTVVS